MKLPMLPTCDNMKSPLGKAAIHAATAVLTLVIAAYHARNALYHTWHWLARRMGR